MPTGLPLLDCELTFQDRDHLWHLDVADRFVGADPSGILQTTRRLIVDLADPDSVAAGTAWWEELTGSGGEGMVVGPLANLVRVRRGLVQPGVKVRGREYPRIIDGLDQLVDVDKGWVHSRKVSLTAADTQATIRRPMGAGDSTVACTPGWSAFSSSCADGRSVDQPSADSPGAGRSGGDPWCNAIPS